MDSVTEIVTTVMKGYAGEGFNDTSYLTYNAAKDTFAVITIGRVKDRRFTDLSLAVQLMGDVVVIDRDANDKPLVDALMQAGIPRDHIVLAYAGESLPTTEVAASSG